ncbi:MULTISPECIES: response regulator [unclassified Sphingomonas]|uniref:response regulator n=1 Tax=unclassified Sphingomonas TaxID=196159 RepID=UPI000A8DEC31|nr:MULTISPECIES: response regulator [unclassified Sphingomonas]
MGQKAPHSAASSETAPAGDPFLGRLLYVEDNAQIAEITCLMLEESGLDIVQATSAEDALRLADEAEPFDIVLTDVVMPGLSGVQLARRLNRRWPKLPIVLVSGFSEELALGYGAQYELLRKPFTRGALLDCLQRHLDGSIYQHA